MKLLVATREGQGREGDFCWTVDGEPVLVMEACDRDVFAAEDGDALGGCGCGRAFSGMGTMSSTTTAVVVESPLTRSDLFLALHSSWVRAGYAEEDLEPEGVIEIEQELDWLLDLADEYEVGTVFERLLDEVRPRGDTEGPAAP